MFVYCVFVCAEPLSGNRDITGARSSGDETLLSQLNTTSLVSGKRGGKKAGNDAAHMKYTHHCVIPNILQRHAFSI